jgi:hypothetical protein
MKNEIWKVKLTNGKVYQCIKYIIDGLFSISIVKLGLKNMDVRINIKWGWN